MRAVLSLWSPSVGCRTVLLLCFLLLGSCQTVPVADIKPGGTHANNTDAAGLILVSDRHEKSLKTAPNRIYDPELVQYLEEMVCELAGSYCKDIRVYVHEVPHFNAYMMPNGAMVVWSGLLLRANSENQLAFVLAHEIGHYVKQHSLKRYRKTKNAAGLLSVINIAVGPYGVFSNLATLGILAKNSRQHEEESDTYAVQVLTQMQRDPASGAQLFATVLIEEGPDKNKGLFLATHPGIETRVETIKQQSLNPPIARDNQLYHHIVQPHHDKWLKDEVAKRQFEETERLLIHFNKRSGYEQSQLDFALAELYRKRGDDSDPEKAIQHYQGYLQNKADKPNYVAYKRLGELYGDLSKKNDAIHAYRRYLAEVPDAFDSSLVQSKIRLLEMENVSE